MRQPRVLLSALALTSLILSGTSAFAQAPAPAPTPTPAPGDLQKPTANPAPTGVAPVSAPATGIVISGLLEANYTYNFNSPKNNANNGYAFNDLAQQFALNLAEIQVQKKATDAARVGFTVKLIEGEVKKLTTGVNDNATANVLEAYGTMLVPFGTRDLTVDVGQFETHVGYETVEIGTNNFFSRSFVYSIVEPVYNAGLRASYPVSPKLTANGYIYNQFNGRTNPGPGASNHDLAPGFQLDYNFNANSSLIFNGLASRGVLATALAAGTKNTDQDILNLVYQNQLTPTRKVVLEGVYRFGKEANNDKYSVYGVSGYLVLGVVGLRAEYLAEGDHPSLINGTGSTKKGNIGSGTISFEPKTGLFPGLRTLLEARYDFANEKLFAGKDAANDKKNQVTLTVGQIYSF